MREGGLAGLLAIPQVSPCHWAGGWEDGRSLPGGRDAMRGGGGGGREFYSRCCQLASGKLRGWRIVLVGLGPPGPAPGGRPPSPIVLVGLESACDKGM
jgi:hypothetical protein